MDELKRTAVPSEQPVRKSSFRIIGWIVIGNLIVAAVLILATIIDLRNSRDVELQRAHEAAENLAHGLSSELAAELRLVDNALTTVSLRYARSSRTPGNKQVLQLAMQEQEKLLPFVSALRAADAAGNIAIALSDGASPFSIADRDYFDAARSSTGMILSEPMVSRAFGGWCVVAARRLQTEDGEFRGIVYVTLSSAHFNQRFRELELGKDGAISLRTDSLRLVARYAAADPDSVKGLGGDQVSEQLRTELDSNPDAGWYITPTALDGIERATAYRRLPGYPLTVLAGLSTEQYLAPWRSSAIRHWSFTALTLLLVAGGSALLYTVHLREHQARLRAARLAKEQTLLLENELVGMLRVKGRRILWANRAACRMLGYAPQQLQHASTRLLYADDATFELVGAHGYASLHAGKQFRMELQVRTSDGRALWVDLSGALLPDAESIWMLADIDRLKHSEEQAQHQSLHDPLTGLANRRLLELQLHQALLQARRSGQEVAVGYLDLDGFKPVNDKFGHDAGDAVLNAVAARLTHEVRANDTVARLGGDEFALVLAGVDGEGGALAVLQRCIETVQQPIAVGAATVTVGCSIGLALSGMHQTSGQTLLQAADAAMYGAKNAGRGRIVIAPVGSESADETSESESIAC